MRQWSSAFVPSAADRDTPTARRLAVIAITFCFLTLLVQITRGNTSLVQTGSYNFCAEDAAVIPLVAAILSRMDVGRICMFRLLLCVALVLAVLISLSGSNTHAALLEFRGRVVLLLFFA